MPDNTDLNNVPDDRPGNTGESGHDTPSSTQKPRNEHGPQGPQANGFQYGPQRPQQFPQPRMTHSVPMAVKILTQPAYGCPATKAFTRYFRKYATFSGRASRSEYWWSRLWVYLLNIGASLLGVLLAVMTGTYSANGINWMGAIIESLLSLALLVPNLAITARRLHDSNRSGWWMLLWIIPDFLANVGAIIAIVIICWAGNLLWPGFLTSVGKNAFGYGDDFDSTFGNSSSPDMSHWWTKLGLSQSGAYSLVTAVIILLVVVLLLAAIGGILGLVFMLLGSKDQGMRFDRPQLAPNDANTLDRYENWKYGQRMGGPTQNQFGTPSQFNQPNQFGPSGQFGQSNPFGQPGNPNVPQNPWGPNQQ